MKIRLLMIVIIFFLFSCRKEPAVITILSSEIFVENINGSTTFEIECSGNWTASVSSLWCSISPLSGSGNSTIKVRVQDNIGDNQRAATIYLSAGDTRESIVIKQGYMFVDIDKDYILFDETSGSQILKITGNSNWTIDIPDIDNWITADRRSGSGDADISFTVSANQGSTRRRSDVKIMYDTDKSFTVSIFQKISGEPLISRPVLTSPADGATGENRVSVFRWEPPAFSLTNELKYWIEVSEDISGSGDWSQTLDMTTYNMIYFDDPLQSNKTYYWRIVAEDINGDRNVSEISSFTTGEDMAYLDGEYSVELSSAKTSPSEIIFIGDGYTPDDFVKGGKFDGDVTEGVNAIFDVEPFKSYKEYFQIYKVAAYSKERGATIGSDSKNTKFGTSFVGGGETSSSTNTVLVREYAMKVSGMDEAKLDDVLIVVISNTDIYAGTAYIYQTGGSIAIVPVSRRTAEAGTNYASIMLHESGGHGFGRLADEYVNKYYAITSSDKSILMEYSELGYFANVDIAGEYRNVKWKHFRNVSGYEVVGVYEGAYHYAIGVWKPERLSCMDNNVPYFNAPSREAIVKRILETAGEEYDFEAFIVKDIEKEPPADISDHILSRGASGFIPLGKPILK